MMPRPRESERETEDLRSGSEGDIPKTHHHHHQPMDLSPGISGDDARLRRGDDDDDEDDVQDQKATRLQAALNGVCRNL